MASAWLARSTLSRIDKITALGPFRVTPSPGGLTFVPAGIPGGGQLKIVSWSGGQWYTMDIVYDGTGTFDITNVTFNTQIAGGPEGFSYVPPGSALFQDFNNVLVSEYSAGKVVAYELDASGNPAPATSTEFITGLTGAEGSVIDPVTGGSLFSTFGGGDRVTAVQGFVPLITVPVLDMWALVAMALLLGSVIYYRRLQALKRA